MYYDKVFLIKIKICIEKLELDFMFWEIRLVLTIYVP